MRLKKKEAVIAAQANLLKREELLNKALEKVAKANARLTNALSKLEVGDVEDVSGILPTSTTTDTAKTITVEVEAKEQETV